MATHKKFEKLLKKRMRRVCGIQDDSLEVSYYMSKSIITVMVIHETVGIMSLRTFDSLEAFIWALILKEEIV